jgi:hypothetical protein
LNYSKARARYHFFLRGIFSKQRHKQAPATTSFWSIPIGWVAFYTGAMGDSFAAKGFAALSIRHVS